MRSHQSPEVGTGNQAVICSLIKSFLTTVMTNFTIMTAPPLDLELFTQPHLCSITANNSTSNSILIGGWWTDGRRNGRRRRRRSERNRGRAVKWKRCSLLECEYHCVWEPNRIMNVGENLSCCFFYQPQTTMFQKVALVTLGVTFCKFNFEVKLFMHLWAVLGEVQKWTAHVEVTKSFKQTLFCELTWSNAFNMHSLRATAGN